MACNYLALSDFPHRGLPLRSWPEFSHIMYPSLGLVWEEYSIINDTAGLNSGIQDTMTKDSLVADIVSLNSVILEK